MKAARVVMIASLAAAAAVEELTRLAAIPFAPPKIPNASDFLGLTVCGYQGWFGTLPNDTAGNWMHWGPLKNGTGIMEDYWPEMTEYDETYAAPGYAFEDGSQAYLFSSGDAQTVMRHYQWM